MGLGEKIIKAINEKLGLKIELTEEAINVIEDIVLDLSDEIVEGGDYGYCPDCDQKRSDGPRYNEGYD